MAQSRSKPGRRRAASKPIASDRVRAEWLRRVEAEYRSAALTQHLALWLIQIGASPDLIRDGLRIVTDELKHAELSHHVYAAAGGQEPPRIVRESLELPRARNGGLEQSVLQATVEVFCLGETVAVRLFKDLRAGAVVPVARCALDRILRDEVRHRDFGWALLASLFEADATGALKAFAERELPSQLARLRATYARPEALRERSIEAADRAWGLMPGAVYARDLDSVLRRDYVPRFGRLGLDALAAWQGAPRIRTASHR
jgi:hypothetical protein